MRYPPMKSIRYCVLFAFQLERNAAEAAEMICCIAPREDAATRTIMIRCLYQRCALLANAGVCIFFREWEFMFARWRQSAPFNNPQIRVVRLNKELLLL